MGTGADMNLLLNPLPKERHPASSLPSPQTPQDPPPGPAHSSSASQHPGWGLRGPTAEGPGCRPPPAAGARSHTRVLQPRAGERSAARPAGTRRRRGCGAETPTSCCFAPHPSPHGGQGPPPPVRLPLPCVEPGLVPAWHPRRKLGDISQLSCGVG